MDEDPRAELRRTREVLREYGLPEHAPAEELRALLRVASALCGASSAVVNLLDDCFQHQIGPAGPTSRSDVGSSMCAAAVLRPELRYLPDARLEPAFADNPWVDGRLYDVRLYLSVPLELPDGRVLGSLCVFDSQPGEVDEVRRAALADIAAQAVALIEHAREAREARAQAELFRLVAESPSDLLSRHALDGTVLWISPSCRSVLGRDADELVGRSSVHDVHPDDRSALRVAFQGVAAGGSGGCTLRNRHADGSWRWLEVLFSPLDGDEDGRQVHSVARDVTARVEAEAALRTAAADLEAARDDAVRRGALMEAVLDTIDVGVVACDADGHLTLFNRASRDFHGLDEDPSLDPTDWADRYALYGADGRTPLEAGQIPLFKALVEGRVAEADIVIAPDGLPARLVRCDGRALHDASGRLLGAVVAQKDETVARAAVDALRASEQRFRSAFSDGPAPMAHLDGQGRITDVNAALRRFVSRTSRLLVGLPLAQLLHEADRPVLQRALAGTRAEPVEVRVLRADGALSWCELACTRSTGDDGGDLLLVQLVDVQSRKQSEQALQQAARKDPLTGAANREGLADQLSELLDRTSGSACPVALLFVDLDRFKQVNDLAGHEAGDEVLRATARRLRQAVRSGDCVARLGGDEFVVVLPGASAAAASALRDRLPELLAEPVLVAGTALRVGASIGMALAEVGDDPSALLARADAAMYVDKRGRGGRLPQQDRRSAVRP